jgi:hypothetical protein
MRVPDALIRRVCFPTSYRLPKEEPMIFPAPIKAVKRAVSSVNANLALSRFVGHTSGSRTTLYPDRSSIAGIYDYVWGNLSNEQYQFFWGRSEIKSGWRKCRICDETFLTDMEAKNHLLASDCKYITGEVSKLVRHTRQCIVCDTKTKKKTWGMVLCSEKCVTEYRFHNPETFTWFRGVIQHGGIVQ